MKFWSRQKPNLSKSKGLQRSQNWRWLNGPTEGIDKAKGYGALILPLYRRVLVASKIKIKTSVRLHIAGMTWTNCRTLILDSPPVPFLLCFVYFLPCLHSSTWRFFFFFFIQTGGRGISPGFLFSFLSVRFLIKIMLASKLLFSLSTQYDSGGCGHVARSSSLSITF